MRRFSFVGAITLGFLFFCGCGTSNSDANGGDGASEDAGNGPNEGGVGVGSRPDGGGNVPPPNDGGDPAACPPGGWDHDANAATPCVAWTTCAAGTYVANTASSTADRQCSSCPSGSFSTFPNMTNCMPWASCNPGTFASTAGTSTSDRQCSVCPSGTYSSSPNQSSCVPNGACAAGTVQTAPGSSGAGPVCATCETGTYCAGDQAPKEACANGYWDHDANSATACVAWTPCVVGQGVDVPGSATADAHCAACAYGSFSTAGVCVPWMTCSAGNYRVAGTNTIDAECKKCPDDTFTDTANQSSCKPHSTCPAGSERTANGSPATDTSCASCGAGTYCPGGDVPKLNCPSQTWDDDQDSKTVCKAWKSCVSGEYFVADGDATHDKTCATCTAGSFSVGTDAASCTTWKDCAPDSRVSTAPSPQNDRVCTKCSTNTYGYGTNASSCTNVVALAGSGGSHTCALLGDRGVRCWGTNSSGELGDGTRTPRSKPVSVSGLTNAVSITGGSDHTCVRRSNDTVSCWGLNNIGQVGDGTTTDALTPTDVGLTNVDQVTSRGLHTCALVNGSVYCWGLNYFGELGDGTTTNRPSPTIVKGLSNVTTIGAGGYHTCAGVAGGAVYCWGYNNYGQLGSGAPAGAFQQQNEPVLVPGVTNVTDIVGGDTFTCARLATGAVRCWGDNTRGALGGGDPGDTDVTLSLSDVTSISAGYYHACAIVSGSSMYCWGDNSHGQIGDGTKDNRLTPYLLTSVPNSVAVGTGWHTCGAFSDASVRCWGLNLYGEIGDGGSTGTDRLSPATVVW